MIRSNVIYLKLYFHIEENKAKGKLFLKIG